MIVFLLNKWYLLLVGVIVSLPLSIVSTLFAYLLNIITNNTMLSCLISAFVSGIIASIPIIIAINKNSECMTIKKYSAMIIIVTVFSAIQFFVMTYKG